MTVRDDILEQTPARLPAPGTRRRHRPAGASRYRHRPRKIVAPLFVLLFVIGGWLLVSYAVLDEQRRFLLPPPQDVFIKGVLDSASRDQIFVGLWSTAQVALTGFAIAIAIGIALAVAMSQAKWVEESLYPYAVILQTVPTLALVPLFGFWLGFNFTSRVAVCVTISLFPIITNTLFGLTSIGQELHDVFTLHRAGRMTQLWKLQLPHALPAIFTGLRISAGLSVIGAIVGDYFFRQGQAGIGRLLDIYRATLQTEKLFTAVFFAASLGLALFWSVSWIGHRLTRQWHPAARPGRSP